MRTSATAGTRFLSLAVLAWAGMVRGQDGRTQSIISEAERVEDVALRDGEFAGWHFGAGPFIEAGSMGGIYAEHRCRSLVRFDVSQLADARVHAAKLRLYKPRCFVQLMPVSIGVYAVMPGNRDWHESDVLCAPAGSRCCWDTRGEGMAWAGGAGCARAGSDVSGAPVDVQVADDTRGYWMEFTVPAEVVQRWIDKPDENAGLAIAAEKTGRTWGEHVFFASSEHHSGKGPQLVVETSGVARPTAATRGSGGSSGQRRVIRTGREFQQWSESRQRLAGFVKRCGMGAEGARLFYHFDTTVRGDMILDLYQAPLSSVLSEIDTACARGDEAAVRRLLRRVWQYLLAWEYIREVDWYTAGPVADVLTPNQLGTLYGECVFGRTEDVAAEEGGTAWRPLSGEALEKVIRDTLESTRRKLKLDAGAAGQILPRVAEFERIEHEHLGKFKAAMDQVRAQAAAGANDLELLQDIRRMHVNHEQFLYYQSIYSAPRWHLFVEKAPAIPFGMWITEVRRSQYTAKRIESQREQVKKYRAREPRGGSGPVSR